MKALSKSATSIFQRLIEGMNEVSAHKRIENSKSFMAVVVEVVDEIPGQGKVVSIAHYYEQEGDLMADPEMTFFVSTSTSEVFPLSYRQDGLGIDQVAARWEHGGWRVNPPKQADMASFADMWMTNIEDQQFR